MKKLLVTASLLALSYNLACAETVGISMSTFDDNYQTVMRNKILDYAGTLNGVEVQIEDAQGDISKQLAQVQNFIASGVDANEVESGTLAAFEACKLLRAKGKTEGIRAYIMIGDLSHAASLQRTKDVHDVTAMDMCKFIDITQEQEAKWSRERGQSLVTNWLTTGDRIDVIFANNDEMALGATQALKAAGINMDDVIVTGVDATADALMAMKAGDLDVTVFQNGSAIGTRSLDAALAMVKGKKVEQVTYIPFELVTPSNVDEFLGKN